MANADEKVTPRPLAEIPSCATCGHPATRHAVDDEERREGLDCGCKQFAALAEGKERG